jgi:3D (Asp-Asp-Asp) domain-containing protein
MAEDQLMIITNVILSFYCACSACTPGRNITASGDRPVEGMTIAAPRWVPLGTKVQITGLPWTFVVQDRLARKKKLDGRWDLFLSGPGAHHRARQMGLQRVDVRILK